MDKTALLQQLRDIHPAPHVAWWPLAVGWWWVLALSIVALLVLRFQYQKRYRRLAAKREALQHIDALERSADSANDIAMQLSTLLRRLSLHYFPEAGAQALTGDNWLIFLDKQGNSADFQQGVGRGLVALAYAPEQPANGESQALCQLVRDWIKRTI